MPLLTVEGSAEPATVEFVDLIGPAATVRLDLMAGPWSVQAGSDFSPPRLRRALPSNLLRDGGAPTAAAFDLREIRLVVQMDSVSDVDFTENIRALYAELVRDTNVLRVQIGTRAVYFRTYAAPDAALRLLTDVRQSEHQVILLADPFGYGERVDLGSFIGLFSADFLASVPAASVLGDVPAPLMVTHPQLTGSPRFVLAGRTGPMPHDPVVEVDTAWTDPSGSGVTQQLIATSDAYGGSYRQVTVPTQNASAYSSGTAIGLRAGQTDRTRLAGTYRAFLISKGQVNNDDRWKVTLEVTGPSTTPVIASVTTTFRGVLDLGLIQAPVVNAQTHRGLDQDLSMSDLNLGLRITRLHATGVGSDSFGYDMLLLIPADEATLLLDYQGRSGSAVRTLTIDPFTGQIVALVDGFVTADEALASYVGRAPSVTPGQDLSLVLARLNASADAAPVSVSLAYWPQFLTVA